MRGREESLHYNIGLNTRLHPGLRIDGFAQYRSRRGCRCCAGRVSARVVTAAKWYRCGTERVKIEWSVTKERIFCGEHYRRVFLLPESVEDNSVTFFRRVIALRSGFQAYTRSHASDSLRHRTVQYVYFYFCFFFFFFVKYLHFYYFILFYVGHCFRLLSLRPCYPT